MSSFIRHIKNEKLGRETDAYYVDDYFGPHEYGVYIPDEDTKIDPPQLGSYLPWDNYLTIKQMKKRGWE